ncbi:MAG: 2-C-methyl-D-erythritol 2,4-cyclodiphosphate synthase [Endomicrobia bacterium]|nr:2-C-methyl-D-erythritol 2,4-cyclodiphosphate synthase [Endomicrobiia bacterium]MCX7940585.1 2-C-methyl-D-erythritol 2,4-cyclodiphosphate synthase [Endomicrobiia bacterium]MDW8056279.1 2-C-methyl-D-erythritol 2,4-cyclodiphosphate synthase [Elusimicrobiota bacterium]
MKYLIGLGYDCHKLVTGRKLYLGGIYIKHSKGLKGHSDADVILHSISDALLSAIGEKDIGELFPDTDKKLKNIESVKIVDKVLKLVAEKCYKIVNIDTVVICDTPKISQYKQEILNSLKKIFQTEFINIKGKSTEGIHPFKNYIQCYTVVLLERLEKNETI